MNDLQAGRLLRELRRRRGWRQLDLAQRAALSQSTQSDAELGRLDRLTLGTIRSMFGTCDATVGLDIRWRGGEVDRLLDAAHAELVREVGEYLARHGWTCWFEVTYSHFGERGSIDVLAVRGDAVLVVEVKSELTSIEATLRKLDEKARHAARIAFERTGRRPLVLGRLLVLPDASTPRRRIAANAAIFDGVLPGRGHAVRAWLKRPHGTFAGIVFLSPAGDGGANKRSVTGRQRIRRRAAAPHRDPQSRTGTGGI